MLARNMTLLPAVCAQVNDHGASQTWHDYSRELWEVETHPRVVTNHIANILVTLLVHGNEV